jgi:23S rRNA pseudoU1915 N3-methylase RlmH
MRKIEILALGQLKNPPLREICGEYYKRCAHLLQIKESEKKNLTAIEHSLENRPYIVVLDPHGQQLDSEQFAQIQFQKSSYTCQQRIQDDPSFGLRALCCECT